MKYETSENTKHKNRERKILWFDPPFSQSVKTNIEKVFLKLVRKHFPRHHIIHKIFNTNTLKLSYCCRKNISNIIKQYNATVLSTLTTPKRLCNGRNKDTCPPWWELPKTVLHLHSRNTCRKWLQNLLWCSWRWI